LFCPRIEVVRKPSDEPSLGEKQKERSLIRSGIREWRRLTKPSWWMFPKTAWGSLPTRSYRSARSFGFFGKRLIADKACPSWLKFGGWMSLERSKFKWAVV